MINGISNATAVLDTGNTAQSMINERLIYKLNLPRIPLPKIVPIAPFAGQKLYELAEITKLKLNIGGLTETHYTYIIPSLSDDILISYL